MYNNEVTYHKAWDTPDNREYQAKVYKLISGRTYVMSDCPVSWAKEVYEFLSFLEEEFGFRYSNLVYLTPKNIFLLLVVDPIKAFFKGPSKFTRSLWEKERFPILKDLAYRFKTLFRVPSWNFKLIRLSIKGRIYNYFKKPKISISQIKEKYGQFRFYFSAPPWLNPFIEEQLVELEIKLSLKGVYYPLKNLWDWHSETELDRRFLELEYQDEKVEIKDYCYRKAAQKLLGKKEFERISSLIERKELH